MPSLVVIADFLQGLTIFLSITAYLPQWITIFRKRSSENISLSSWLLWLLSAGFTLFYAVVQMVYFESGHVLVITSLLAFAFILFTAGIIIYFRSDYEGQENADPHKV